MHGRDDKVCSILFRPTFRRLAALYADPQLKKARSSPRPLSALAHQEQTLRLVDLQVISPAPPVVLRPDRLRIPRIESGPSPGTRSPSYSLAPELR